MKNFSLILILVCFTTVLLKGQDAFVTPISAIESAETRLEFYFSYLQQGRVGLIRIIGNDIQAVSGTVFDSPLHFFRVETVLGDFAFIPVRFEQTPRLYTLTVTMTYSTGLVETLQAGVDIESGEFIQQDVILTGEQSVLVDETIEANELSRILALANIRTPDKLWDSNGFRLPIDAELTSPFGAVRVFNGFLTTRHTGWDLQAQIGRPMITTAAGKVAFAGRMDIRGNYVLIDHGHGIFSGYAHLSVIYVTQGQSIHAGQIIGQVGTTGRSSSPHAHFEMLVNGVWIDAAEFLQMPLP